MFHYVACGLPNVYLVNGHTPVALPDGSEGYRIDNPKGLHRAIGMHIASKEAILDGDEFRFLRTELHLSRKSLAEKLGVSAETVKKWESGENPVSKTADAVLRTIYRECHNESSAMRSLIEQINHAERVAAKEVRFEEVNGGWKKSNCG